MKKFLAISLIVCMVFGLAACTKPKATDTENTQQTETTPLQKINYILEKEGQPTAGYEWTATSDDESIVVVTITNNLADLAKDEHETLLVGVPVTYTIEFAGVKEGETSVHLVYKRSFEDSEFDIYENYFVKVINEDNKLVVNAELIQEDIQPEVDPNVDPEFTEDPMPSDKPDEPEVTPEPVVEEEPKDRVFYLYSIVASSTEIIDLKTMVEANLNPKDVYVILHPDGFGEIGFGMLNDQETEAVKFAYDDYNFVVNYEKLKYVINEQGHLLLTSDGEIMELAPADEVEKLLDELTAEQNNRRNLLIGKWVSDIDSYVFNADRSGIYTKDTEEKAFAYEIIEDNLYIKFADSDEAVKVEYTFNDVNLILNGIEYKFAVN